MKQNISIFIIVILVAISVFMAGCTNNSHGHTGEGEKRDMDAHSDKEMGSNEHKDNDHDMDAPHDDSHKDDDHNMDMKKGQMIMPDSINIHITFANNLDFSLSEDASITEDEIKVLETEFNQNIKSGLTIITKDGVDAEAEFISEKNLFEVGGQPRTYLDNTHSVGTYTIYHLDKSAKIMTKDELVESKKDQSNMATLSVSMVLENKGMKDLASEITNIKAYAYIGADETPFDSWMGNTGVPKLEAKSKLRSDRITFNKLTSAHLLRLLDGEALTLRVVDYEIVDGDKKPLVVIDVDNGEEISRMQIFNQTQASMTLTHYFNEHVGFFDLREKKTAICCLKLTSNEKLVSTRKHDLPYGWWTVSILGGEDKYETIPEIVMAPGMHIVMRYEKDSDGNGVTDFYEVLKST